MSMFCIGKPCPALTVDHSNTDNMTLLYTDVHEVICDAGFQTTQNQSSETVYCEGDQSHNSSFNECLRKSQYAIVHRTLISFSHS